MPFTVQDPQQQNEVVCPLNNADGSHCRKRCFGVSHSFPSSPYSPLAILTESLQEKRYRSMQEHIRRAHPEHYLPKLPATEESFRLMINTPPHAVPERPPALANHNHSHSSSSNNNNHSNSDSNHVYPPASASESSPPPPPDPLPRGS